MKKSVILMLLLAGCSTANYVVSNEGSVRYKDAVKSSRFGDEADVYDCNKVGSDYTLFCDKDGSPYYGNVSRFIDGGVSTSNLSGGNIVLTTFVSKDENRGNYFRNGSNNVWGAYYSLNKKHLPSKIALNSGRFVYICEDGKISQMEFDKYKLYNNFTIDGVRQDGMIYGNKGTYTINDTPITGVVEIFDCENNLVKKFPLANGKIDGEAIFLDKTLKTIAKYKNGKIIQNIDVYLESPASTFLGENDEQEIIFDTEITNFNNQEIFDETIYKLNNQEVLFRCGGDNFGEYTPQSPEWEDIKKSGFKCPQKVSEEL